ncbi:hypothetical protein [Pseudomonas graminis]
MNVQHLRTHSPALFIPTTHDSVVTTDASDSVRTKRAYQVVDLATQKLATGLVKAGDAALCAKYSATLMEQIIAYRAQQDYGPAANVIADIPPFSTFALAWAELTHAIENEPFASFAKKHQIDTSTLTINTRGGWFLSAVVNGERAFFSKADEGYEAATAALNAAAKTLSPTRQLLINYTGPNSAPANVVGDFYAANDNNTEPDKLRLIAQHNQYLTFDALRPGYSAASSTPAQSQLRHTQTEAIENLAGQITTTPDLLSPAQRNLKPSVEEADLQMARMYSSALLNLRPEMRRLVDSPRSGFLVSEIPEYSTLGQTLRNSSLAPGKDTQLSLDWIGKFYAQAGSDDTLTAVLKQTSSLNRNGFNALSQDNPLTDKRSLGAQQRQRAVIQHLDRPSVTQPGEPVSAPVNPAAAINPMTALARRQFDQEPSLQTVIARLLSDSIKIDSPALDVDVNQIAIATPDPANPGQLKQTPLLTLAWDYLTGGAAATFTHTHQALDTRPDLLARTGNPAGVPLPLDLSALSAAIRALPSQLDAAAQADSREYWGKPAFSAAADAGIVFPGSHQALVSGILRSNLQQSGLKQAGLDDEQRKTVEMVVSHPEGSTRPAPADSMTSGATVYTVPGATPNLLIHRALSQPDREILLLVEPSGKITPYDTWDDVPNPRHRLETVSGNMFDVQADALIQRHQGNRLANSAQLNDTQPLTPAKNQLPDWLSNAGDAERFVMHALSLDLASATHSSKGRTYNSDIPDIRTFAQAQFDALPDSQKLTQYAAKDLEVVFKVPYGTLSSGFIDRQTMSLTDMLLNNLAGLPNGQIEVFFKTGLKADGVDIKTRVPALEKEGVLKQLVDNLDIGKTYPALLKQKLLDDPVKKAERQALFVRQVPIELQIKALQLSITGESGFNPTGFRYVQEILKPGPGPKTVDGKEITLRPLAFDNKANGKVDVVEGAYLIEPKDNTTGPHILYRPLIADAPLLQFPSRQALLEAIQTKGKLQNDSLAWLPDEDTRKLYTGNGFKHPNLVIFGHNLGSVAANPTIPLAVDTRLQQTVQEGKLLEHLFEANAQSLINLAEQQSTSDAQSRWASLKTGGFLLLNAVLPALRGPAATLGLLLQGEGIIDDVQTLRGDNTTGKEAAVTDLLVNLASLLLHFSTRSPGAAVGATSNRSVLVDESATRATTPANRTVLGGPAQIKPLAGDIQVFEDNYDGEKRLTIMGHSEKPIEGEPSQIVGADGRRYSAEDIDNELLARGIDIQDYRDVRLLACYSGVGGEQSLAAKLHQLTDVRVKGYEQEVITEYKSIDGEDPFKIYENATAHYRATYPSLSDAAIHDIAERVLSRQLGKKGIDFIVRKDTGAEVEHNIGSDETPDMRTTTVNHKPVVFGTPRSKRPPAKVEVTMGYSHTVEDKKSVISTRSLTDCSALAVLTDLKDGVYQKRTLMHLTGSNLEYGLFDKNSYQVLDELDKSLTNGGKVIFVGGIDSQSAVGMGVVLGQEFKGRKPLLDILRKPGVDTTIASSVGVDIKPDGSFNLIEGTGMGVFTQSMINAAFDFAD